MRPLTAGVAALLLASCAGHRPAAPLGAAVQAPNAWRTVASRPDRMSDPAWWGAFGDPVLSGVVETALARNTDLALAAARVEEARAQFRLAQAQRLPNLVGVAGGARQRDVGPFGAPRLQTVGQAQVSISYDTDLFGRLAQTSAAARASLLATEAGRDGVRLAVATSAAIGYINLRGLDARLDVLQSTLRSRAAVLAFARRRADAGYSSRLDLRQAEAEYHATEQLIPGVVAAIIRQENGLAVLLGAAPQAITRGRTLASLTAPGVDVGLPADLLRSRPDIAQAEQQLVAADRSLDAVRAAFMPSIQLTAAGGVVESNLLRDPLGVFSVGGSVLSPLLGAGRLQALQGVAAARRDQAAYGYRKAALNAFREVEDALAAERGAADQTAAVARQVTALASALALATNRYRAGYAPFLEQLDAQRALLAAELTLVQAQADRLNATVALYQVVGGGW